MTQTSPLKFQCHNPAYHSMYLHHRESLRSSVLKTAQYIHRLTKTATEHNVGKWHIDPVLGNNTRKSKYVIVVSEQRLNKQTCSHSNKEEERCFLCSPCRGVMSSVRYEAVVTQ